MNYVVIRKFFSVDIFLSGEFFSLGFLFSRALFRRHFSRDSYNTYVFIIYVCMYGKSKTCTTHFSKWNNPRCPGRHVGRGGPRGRMSIVRRTKMHTIFLICSRDRRDWKSGRCAGDTPLWQPVAKAFGSSGGTPCTKKPWKKPQRKTYIHSYTHTHTHNTLHDLSACFVFPTQKSVRSVRTKPFCSAVTVRQHFINDTFPGNPKIQVST